MSQSYDVIVLGLGGMGSAAAAHLARRGLRTLGLERFGPAHDRGSSHGDTRVIRQAYAEGPAYVPLLQRAYELWADLDRDDPGLFVQTGGLSVGPPDTGFVAGAVTSAQRYDLPYELLEAAEMRARFPTFAPSEGEVGFYEARGGSVRPERTVRAHLRRAAAAGAELRFEEPALSWSADGEGVQVRTGRNTYRAGRLVVAPGAWAPAVLRDLGLPLSVERQVQYWFQPAGGVGPYEGGPVFAWQWGEGDLLYGFPALDGPDGGVKVAFHGPGIPTDPDALDREVHEDEVETIQRTLAPLRPGLADRFLRGRGCLYTNTPDGHFVIAQHPAHDAVVVACGFSGHGFKFVPVVGEVLADLVVEGTTPHPIDLFAPSRLAAVPGL